MVCIWPCLLACIAKIVLSISPNSFGYDIFCNNLQHKKHFKQILEVSVLLSIYVTDSGKARVMLHTGAGHSKNYQITLKLFRYDIFCNYLQH